MTLAPGTRLGSYEILGPIGAGGMGEVYRARDTKLNREVAVKILPPTFTHDPERVARFQREAQVLATLNHPHIAAIYGLDSVDGVQFLVLELVVGEPLDARIARGPLAVGEAIALARQIADALDAAHGKGIVHRDLKPANVAVSHDGQVKVLDFGLAKGAEAVGGSLPHAATITSPAMLTGVGVILGTAAYMSPEQAKGQPVDKRADVWAFGVVLFEMLTGRRLFDGETISEVLAGVLKEQPAWNSLPADTPPAIRRVLSRCLQKDPKQRLRDIGDARLDLDDRETAAPATVPRTTRAAVMRTFAAVATGAALIALALALVVPSWRRAPEAPLQRLSVIPPAGTTLFDDADESAISPDGRSIVFRTGHGVGPGQVGTGSHLWIRGLDEGAARMIAGTEEAFLPFWAPDSRRLGFFMQGKLKTLNVDSGAISTVCDTNEGRGGAWGGDTIVFAPSTQGPLMRVSANGGDPRPATTLNAARHEIAHRFPSFLPDGRHFVFAALVGSRNNNFTVFAGSLDGPDTTQLVSTTSAAVFAEPGFLLFDFRGALIAQPFDPRRVELRGEPTVIGDTPAGSGYTGGRVVSASSTGTLLTVGGTRESSNSKLVWLDSTSGKEIGAIAVPPGHYENVRIAPDGRHAAIERFVPPFGTDIWIVDLERGGASRFTNGTGANTQAQWSPDSTRIAFASNRNGSLEFIVRGLSGAAADQSLAPPNMFTNLDGWSHDGRFIMFDQLDPKTGDDLWVMPLDVSVPPKPYLNTPFHEQNASFSPDGHWVTYVSDESGLADLWVQSFPVPGNKYRVTTEGVINGWWTPDGSIVYVRSQDRQLVVVKPDGGATFHTGPPRALMTLPSDVWGFDGDGSKFLALRPSVESLPPSLTVVLNWTAALKKH